MAKLVSFIAKILSSPFLLLIRAYQLIISPIWPSMCRFDPSCSHYGMEAFRKRGPFIGLILTVKRIASCHPWGGMGDDPVPEKGLFNPKEK
jgi:putative membrane protein insertion efficiency factor